MGKIAVWIGILLVLPQVVFGQAAGELDYSAWGHHHLHTWWTILFLVGITALVTGVVLLVWWGTVRRKKK